MGIGICLVGNYDKEVPAEASLKILRRLCRALMEEFEIMKENVIGHREAQVMGGVPGGERKSCPGKMFDMDAFRESLFTVDS